MCSGRVYSPSTAPTSRPITSMALCGRPRSPPRWTRPTCYRRESPASYRTSGDTPSHPPRPAAGTTPRRPTGFPAAESRGRGHVAGMPQRAPPPGQDATAGVPPHSYPTQRRRAPAGEASSPPRRLKRLRRGGSVPEGATRGVPRPPAAGTITRSTGGESCATRHAAVLWRAGWWRRRRGCATGSARPLTPPRPASASAATAGRPPVTPPPLRKTETGRQPIFTRRRRAAPHSGVRLESLRRHRHNLHQTRRKSPDRTPARAARPGYRHPPRQSPPAPLRAPPPPQTGHTLPRRRGARAPQHVRGCGQRRSAPPAEARGPDRPPCR